MGVGKPRGLDAFLIGGIQPPIADVIHDGAGKEIDILKHHAKAAAQVTLFDFIDIDAVIADLAVGDIIKAVDEIGDGGLAGAGGPDKGDLLPRFGVEGDIMQDGLSLHIGEVHILHADVTVLTDQLIAALRQGLFPCPDAGTVVGFDQGAVYLLGVHQGDHAVILLARFIHQFKDAFGTGQRHDDRVDLLGDLADGHGEAAGKLQKGSDTAQRHHADSADGEIGDRGDGQKPADNGDQYILQVAEVAHDGHHDIGVGVGLGGVEAEFIIEGVKVLLVLLLVAEYLDDLLPADHFLDKAIDPTEGLLLLDEIFGAAAADLFHDDHHQPQKDEHQQREPYAGA